MDNVVVGCILVVIAALLLVASVNNWLFSVFICVLAADAFLRFPIGRNL